VRNLVLVGAILLMSSCAPAIHSTLGRAPTADELASFWVEPGGGHDAFYGPGGRALAPSADVVYTLKERKGGGFSPKIEVEDPKGVKWDVKMGEEAQAEVTCSRILWAVGYRQPPEYYLQQWQVKEEAGVHPLGPGRFRPSVDDFHGKGSWPWRANPFAGTVQFRGLLTLLMILNSSDLKDDNNEIYEVRRDQRPPQTWYTVKDLGSSLGQTGWAYPKRNDIDFFEKEAFITGVDKGHVRFAFKGHYKDLIRHITPEDVGWICMRLRRLTRDQWRDAFRAGGYDEATTARYLRKIDEKIEQGLSISKGSTR
jgi:hypothetical protein